MCGKRSGWGCRDMGGDQVRVAQLTIHFKKKTTVACRGLLNLQSRSDLLFVMVSFQMAKQPPPAVDLNRCESSKREAPLEAVRTGRPGLPRSALVTSISMRFSHALFGSLLTRKEEKSVAVVFPLRLYVSDDWASSWRLGIQATAARSERGRYRGAIA